MYLKAILGMQPVGDGKGDKAQETELMCHEEVSMGSRSTLGRPHLARSRCGLCRCFLELYSFAANRGVLPCTLASSPRQRYVALRSPF